MAPPGFTARDGAADMEISIHMIPDKSSPAQASPPPDPARVRCANRSAWGSAAERLAAWAWARLVNRTDIWGGYNRLCDRDKVITRGDGTTYTLGATTTRPARRDRGKVELTPTVL